MRLVDLYRVSGQERCRARQRGVLLGTVGYLLALGVLLLLRLVGITRFSTAHWLGALGCTVAIQALLWSAPRFGWDARLKWDRHYIYVPMIVAVGLLNGYIYMAPEVRFILMMVWFAALLYTVGYAGALSVLTLNLMFAACYLIVIFGLTDPSRIGSTAFELAVVGSFLIITAYAAVVFESLRRERRSMKDLQRQLLEASITEPMTGLYNYREFYRRLQEEIHRAERYGRSFALLLVDIDRLKAVNDLHGHLKGDALIQQVARLIRENIRPSDVAYRYGGDEFFVLLPETSREGAQTVAERISRIIAATSLLVGPGQVIYPTVSIGLAVYPEHGRTTEEIIVAADRALYVAKQARSSPP
ncbi:MAG: GGDEF domain-containing protein [Acidobacteria bacterium]|nr:GGDEF domain-containing protein [Acidobacteriota bacterium]MDW7983508.1 GGDEF domain-containing protein [Acidobacteriota bacterium]